MFAGFGGQHVALRVGKLVGQVFVRIGQTCITCAEPSQNASRLGEWVDSEQSTSARSSETELKLLTVRPVAKWPNALRKWCWAIKRSSGVKGCADVVMSIGQTSPWN